MDKIISTKVTPYNIVEKRKDFTLMISPNGDYRNLCDSEFLMKDFEQGDYIFQKKTIGKGFVRYDYTKMNEKEREKHFPDSREPRNIFSKFKDSSIFQ